MKPQKNKKNEPILFTKEGYSNLLQELEYLKTVKRKEVIEKIKEARSFGDLSENAEYDAAKEEQAQLENRIMTIEKMLKNIEIIDEEKFDKSSIHLGSKVKIEFLDTSEIMEIKIVPRNEVNIKQNKFSTEAPLGKTIIGHKKGDIVVIDPPFDKSYKIKILEVN